MIGAPVRRRSSGRWPQPRGSEQGYRDNDEGQVKFASIDGPQRLRAGHAALAHPSGRVLILGGLDEQGQALSSTEWWDPTRGRWEAGPELEFARQLLAATVLLDGRVLAVGGSTGGGRDVRRAELWDPARDAFEECAQPRYARGYRQQLVMLSDGRVLLTGGRHPPELWSLDTDRWSALKDARGRYVPAGHAALLTDGRVLFDPAELIERDEPRPPASLLWSPRDASYTPAGAPPRRVNHLLHPVGVGGAIAVGGISCERTTARWDGSWRETGELASRRSDHASAVLSDGRVLVVGGNQMLRPVLTAEVWSPASGAWERAGRSGQARLMFHTVTALPDGRALVVGGKAEEGLSGTEIWEP